MWITRRSICLYTYGISELLDDEPIHDILVVMESDGISKITRAYNKILAVMVDPDVQAVFGDGHLLSRETDLPEIQLDDLDSRPQGSRK